MPRVTSKNTKETLKEYIARKINKYKKLYNLDRSQIKELLENGEIEVDSDTLGNLTKLKYNKYNHKFTQEDTFKTIEEAYDYSE